MLSKPSTARRGNMVSSLGMLLAIVATLCYTGMDYKYIIVGAVIGSLIGAAAAHFVEMTGMPQMVAAFNGFGGIASLLVGWAEYQANPSTGWGVLLPISLAVLIGGVTFTGSMIAYAKLAGRITTKPVLFPGQNVFNGILMLVAVGGAIAFCLRLDPGSAILAARYKILIGLVVISLILGVLAVIPIGGADMPVVISLLNSYSGLAACAAGFVIRNNVLIVAGSLVGASGLILTNIMCKAMNRSLANVLFSGFGAGAQKTTGAGLQGEADPINVADAYLILEAAGSVVFVPGYGMAVAQAQHAVRELGEQLEANGCEVRYCIHPVAGRMPGHMNVLLAEANVSYDQLVEPDDVNPHVEEVDVCMVIGANDVVNPAARDDDASAIYGMPIVEVDRAKTVFVLKRSMASGFAGVDNPLFFGQNTRMLFGDAKQSVTALVAEFKGE